MPAHSVPISHCLNMEVYLDIFQAGPHFLIFLCQSEFQAIAHHQSTSIQSACFSTEGAPSVIISDNTTVARNETLYVPHG